MSLASVLAFLSPASAATNIRGAEKFDTDKLLMSLCTGSTKRTYWWFNVETGAVTVDKTLGYPASKLPYPIERFWGFCSYPESSSWTWPGSDVKIGNTLVNCAYGSTISQTTQVNGTTTSTTANSISGSVAIEWTPLAKVLSIEAGASYTHTWSYAKSKGWATTNGITVNPRRAGWLVQRPIMRTVRSNPVFHIDTYIWGNSNGKEVTSHTWRGRGYSDINSRGAYYDAVGNTLGDNGLPIGEVTGKDRAVNSNDHC
ncbi:hypothetical protein [Streptomyces sp. NPDC005799]|uniref:hypothetical protein n=1 Tax=Streptomyces sp. NPDC005799 TaxID=3154678 RepID=UPI00340BCF91